VTCKNCIYFEQIPSMQTGACMAGGAFNGATDPDNTYADLCPDFEPAVTDDDEDD